MNVWKRCAWTTNLEKRNIDHYWKVSDCDKVGAKMWPDLYHGVCPIFQQWSRNSFGEKFLGQFSFLSTWNPGKAWFISYIRVTSAKIYRAQQKSKNVPKNMDKFSVVRLHLRRDKELGRRCLTQRVFISYFYIWKTAFFFNFTFLHLTIWRGIEEPNLKRNLPQFERNVSNFHSRNYWANPTNKNL